MALFGRRKKDTAAPEQPTTTGGTAGPQDDKPTMDITSFVAEPETPARSDSPSTPWSTLMPGIRPLSSQVLPEYAPYLLWRPAGPYLAEIVVQDMPDKLELVNATLVDGWEGGVDDWCDAARDNLRAQPLGADLVRLGTERVIGPARIAGPEGYASAWPLVADRMRTLVGLPDLAPAAGDPVVVMPDRDTCYVTTTADEAGIESALDSAFTAYLEGTDHPVSPVAYVVTDEGLVPYRAPQPGGLANKVHRALAYFEFREQAAQYEWLKADEYAIHQRLEDQRGKALRLSGAGTVGLSREDPSRLRRTTSIVQIEADDDYLVLPSEDVVMIGDAFDGMLVVDRGTFDRVCAHRLDHEPLLPLGGTVLHGWPSDDELGALASVGDVMPLPQQ